MGARPIGLNPNGPMTPERQSRYAKERSWAKMLTTRVEASEDVNPTETHEWLDALDEIIDEGGPERASYLLQRLLDRAAAFGATAPLKLNTPYMNSIPVEEE